MRSRSRKHRMISFAAIFLVVVFTPSVRADSPAPSALEVSQHEVLPILLLRCTVCHGGRKAEGELDLRSRASMLRGGKSGPAMVPGKPDESLMLKRLEAEEMPPRRRLVEVSVKTMEDGEIATLRRWIELGAPQAPDPPPTGSVVDDPLVSEKDRGFWSLRSPRRGITAPEVRDVARVRGPVDAFILRRLEERGLALAPEAEPRVLIRRATFDLTGLPPEPGEIDAFLADERHDAYERLIDGLLDSPRYGERWGRHWLDVAGYSDSEGKTNQDKLRHENYRYRDYVIRAHNADKPFDRFLLEQIAGDELADYESSSEITQEVYDNLVATAFLRQGPDGTWAGITAFVPDRLEVISDAIDVLGRGVLGMTLKCARCHSHKFDPIPQRDYYRLAAMLKGAYDEHDWLKPQSPDKGYIGQRFLPHVTARERRARETRIAEIDAKIVELRKPAAGAKEVDKTTKEKIEALEKEKPKGELRIRALWDRGDPSPTYLLTRGNYLTPGVPLEPGVLSALAGTARPPRIEPPWPGAKQTGRRLALARWLVDPEHPLTARVAVNRVWKHHFETGLVASLGNFGRIGARPTHPELLDWLARRFIADGWSLKSLHRLIMTSSVYRQGSKVSAVVRRADPANRLLSRFPLKRLEAEAIRDSILFVAGRLSESPFGPADGVSLRGDGLVTSSSTDGKWRRSIYVRQRRTQLPTILEVFDLQPMNPNCLERPRSTVATQALHLLNNGMVQELAQAFARRVADESPAEPARRIERAFLRALGRVPTREEMALTRGTYDELRALWSKERRGKDAEEESPDLRALVNVCHALLNSAELIHVD